MNLHRMVSLLIIMGCGLVSLQPMPACALPSGATLEDTADTSGRKYYVLTADITNMQFQQFNWIFSTSADNATTEGPDNATGTGSVTIEQAGKTFEDAAGAYLSNGDFYNGTWEATEKNYSSFYEEDIYTYYSFLFYGFNIADNALTQGIIYSTVRNKSPAKGDEEIITVLLYVGMLVSQSASTLPGPAQRTLLPALDRFSLLEIAD